MTQRSLETTKPSSIRPKTSQPKSIQRTSHNSSTQALLNLQSTVGNRAVQRLLASKTIQAKLTVGPANDRYEQEADQVANQVLAPTPQPASGNLAPRSPKSDETAQRKPLASAISPLTQNTQSNNLQPESDATSGKSFEADQSVEPQLEANRGRGAPLPGRTRSFMESKFGSDFGNVRIHTGGPATQVSRQLSAQAFTQGSDIYFGAGKYNPSSASGNKLLAHELTHVVQQGAAARRMIQKKGEGDTPSARTDEQLRESATAMLTPDQETEGLQDRPPTRHVIDRKSVV